MHTRTLRVAPAGATRHIKVHVPVIRQKGRSDCWNASLQMLTAYHQVPDIDLSLQYGPPGTLPRFVMGDFVRRAGLVRIEEIKSGADATAEKLMSCIAKHGPLWCVLRAGMRHDSGWHVVVLTGVENDCMVTVNDPLQGEITRPLWWFQQRLDLEPNAYLTYLAKPGQVA